MDSHVKPGNRNQGGETQQANKGTAGKVPGECHGSGKRGTGVPGRK